MANKVLLVEDDPFLSSLLGNRLKKEGFELGVEHTGTNAVKMLKDMKPNLVLLDLILPGKSGFEVMEEMSADPQAPKTPVIIISNLGQEADVMRGKELGAVDYVVKARMTIDDMVSRVKSFFVTKK